MEYHTATRCMRSKSPYTVKLDRVQRDVAANKYALVNKNKIHRILLNSTAEVEFIDMVSPSCIWVRLLNHVTENMDLKTPYPITQALIDEYGQLNADYIKQFGYYLAPRLLLGNTDENGDDMVYSRVRVLRIKNITTGKATTLFCYVHYIDHGFGNWVQADCLAVMPKNMFTKPWQAVPVSLMGVSPVQSYDVKKDKWTSKQCDILRSVLEKYKRFEAEPYVCKYQTIYNYNNYARVELKAITNSEQEEDEGVDENDDFVILDNADDQPAPKSQNSKLYKPAKISVAYEFFFESRRQGESTYIDSQFDELTDQELFGVESKELDADYEIPELERNLPKYRCEFPTDELLGKTEKDIEDEKQAELKRREKRAQQELFAAEDPEEYEKLQREKKQEKENALLEWDANINKIETLTAQVPKLPEAPEHLFVMLSAACLNSPYDFYGHLIQPKGGDVESADIGKYHEAMLEFYERLDRWQGKLNNFYLNSANCKKFKVDDIKKRLFAGESVYAIMCKFDHLEQSNFVRVKVVRLVNKNNLVDSSMFCDVRLLDHGGTITINMDTLLRMHSEHAVETPFAVQMCLYNVCPKEKAEQNDMVVSKDSWKSDAKDAFQRLTPTDSPMQCELVSVWKEEENDVVGHLPIYQSVDTYFVENLRLVSTYEEKTIESRLIKKGYAVEGQCPLE